MVDRSLLLMPKISDKEWRKLKFEWIMSDLKEDPKLAKMVLNALSVANEKSKKEQP